MGEGLNYKMLFVFTKLCLYFIDGKKSQDLSLVFFLMLRCYDFNLKFLMNRQNICLNHLINKSNVIEFKKHIETGRYCLFRGGFKYTFH